MTLWRMRIACWVHKATNTLRICNTYYFSTATMVARTNLNVTLYLHCLSCPRTVNFTCHLSYSRWATFSSASSRTLQRTSRYSAVGSDRTLHENRSNWGATRSCQGEITFNVARNYLSSYFVNNSQCRYIVKMTFFV